MKVISVEEDEEESLIFRFSSESRVDLHDLIKKLQDETQKKVTLHQMGQREEARILSGVGPCGQRLCCAAFLKTLPTLPSDKYSEKKIGLCSKPMCCLAFEEKAFIKEGPPPAGGQQFEAEPTPQTQPQATAKPPPQRILRILPQRKSRHRR